ncbi:PREDICTED: GATA transcription factor 16-like [Ipomoea nil]|uniref:GATA transcription factor 16-like n=1 Tax=Ipomoea nil TaxID=35883 RepID=UPI0009009B35|nr:PREDICTED: GATA transcription factor 16-like [Ipomoea nil]
MVDLSDRGSESEDMSSQTPTPERETNTQIKTCADCGTTKTPLWRGGPAGPKSLCNACGIRSRKRRRALLGLNKDDKKSKKSAGGGGSNKNSSGSSSDSGSSSGGISPGSGGGGRRFLPFGREVALQKPRSQQARRKMGEVEKAAFLLMALSCGSVFA